MLFIGSRTGPADFGISEYVYPDPVSFYLLLIVQIFFIYSSFLYSSSIYSFLYIDFCNKFYGEGINKKELIE